MHAITITATPRTRASSWADVEAYQSTLTTEVDETTEDGSEDDATGVGEPSGTAGNEDDPDDTADGTGRTEDPSTGQPDDTGPLDPPPSNGVGVPSTKTHNGQAARDPDGAGSSPSQTPTAAQSTRSL